ncbi:hypothetical protein EN804_27325 [Mesorhizobium sp. M8A.F.Ca.ET.161.01.1.1]|uniref:LysR substrate-binding domain-containing protein n=1 Tax=unclassified Mesorhizobium TaxID=325217 RepID=UPI000FCC3275|nr:MULTISPECIES: LysR substrate-binding domain-containing protein [unclassified Mesorhizobium]TGW07106.1 hypothetical protein EN788_38580 [Mesorhizobium sp. M2D.F.Ca.ET.145.01.1.1]TIS90118.1 MAG: hypothetical protein E5W88_21940 [Mesorhizobium sp.]RUW51209.1 hypothetical protein EOA36_15000 [Mesorhizobium sp. M8A.F.Ca.ET.021.01.1.1]TGQ02282.1 hypothetical protein EN861_06255 [Mesorhizobium sp. M8A.F.Ca.ET.218.01.1.1]TGS37051.1 hypothetical protein EN825_32185 [Mesorhizobium sp. M8A.F.Ca.ET.182
MGNADIGDIAAFAGRPDRLLHRFLRADAFEHGVGASPDYLARHPAPGTPQDLVQYDCINHRQSRSGGLYAWEFARDGRELRVRVDGQLTFNSTIPMIDATVSGLGIAYVPENLVTDELRSGRLVLMLDEWCPLFPGYYLYYPTRRQNSPAFAVIANALRHADV